MASRDSARIRLAFGRDRGADGAPVPDKTLDLPADQYIYFVAEDGTEIKVEMRDGELWIWNQGNTPNFSVSVVPVSSNVVKILPTR